MIAHKEIPSLDQLRDFGHAVAGHAGTMSDDSGSLFIKPCTQSEVDFYQSANASRRHRDFADLMPVFCGTLSLNDPSSVRVVEEAAIAASSSGDSAAAKDEISAVVAEAVANVSQGEVTPSWTPKSKSKKIETELAIALESSTYGFKRPNILDAKLGIRLWADDAPAEKKMRFDKISSETTHKNLGFRIAGMRVFRGSEDSEQLDDEEYRVYDKDYGRTTVNDNNIVDAFRKFVFVKTAGITEELGKAVSAAFAHDLQRVEDIVSREESRMYSASLLFAFEGDGATLRSAIEENNAAVETAQEKIERTTKRVDSGIVLEDDDDDLDLSSLPQIYTLKLIDFAHAEWTPGKGPDENVLVGVRSLKRIFEELAQ